LKAPYCILIYCLLFTHFCTAQVKKKTNKKVLEVKQKIKLVMRPDSVAPFIISAEGDSINKTDVFNVKQGLWVLQIPERFGEPSYLKYGMYKNDWKIGKWKTYQGPNLISEENYVNNVLDGEILFYENGFLSCRGYYSGANYRAKFDTIILENTQTNQTQTYIVQNNPLSVKDSTWIYFLPNSKMVKSIEYWRNDEFISGQELASENTGLMDSASAARYEKLLPHNQKKVIVPFSPNKKKQSSVRYAQETLGTKRKN
jgi:hypothetical protein